MKNAVAATRLLAFLAVVLFLPAVNLVQAAAQTDSIQTDSTSVTTESPAPSSELTEEQIRTLIREAAERDLANDKAQSDYTYVQREEEHKLNGRGELKTTKSRTFDVMMIYDEQVRKLTARDDQPLPAKEAAKQDEKIQKLIDKRKNESADNRDKRLEKEARQREEDRQFVREIADAYNFRFAGIENREGRETYVIDADPRPGYQPRIKNARFLPKFRFRVWIDRAEKEWVRLDIQCVDTVSVGLFLVRLHKGSNVQIDQTRVNDEVWLPRHITLKLDARVALFKGVSLEEEVTYRDYKKFRTDTKILPAGDPPQRP